MDYSHEAYKVKL